MRYLLLYLILFCACKSKQKLNLVELATQTEICPKDGTCTFKVVKNKIIKLKYNNFNDFYPTYLDGNKHVFKFEYKRKDIPNTQDSGYREEVIIELDPENIEIETTNFKSKKMLFARWCYCKGQTGYYKIKQGKLEVRKMDNNMYKLNLTFSIDEVPQVITEITQIFSLD